MRAGGIGIFLDGQAGSCMGQCMCGVRVHDDGDVMGEFIAKKGTLSTYSVSRNYTVLCLSMV